MNCQFLLKEKLLIKSFGIKYIDVQKVLLYNKQLCEGNCYSFQSLNSGRFLKGPKVLNTIFLH